MIWFQTTKNQERKKPKKPRRNLYNQDDLTEEIIRAQIVVLILKCYEKRELELSKRFPFRRSLKNSQVAKSWK